MEFSYLYYTKETHLPPIVSLFLNHELVWFFFLSFYRFFDLEMQQAFGRPRPQPIACTPPPEALVGLNNQEKCDAKTIQHTCSLFGLDLVRSILISFDFEFSLLLIGFFHYQAPMGTILHLEGNFLLQPTFESW